MNRVYKDSPQTLARMKSHHPEMLEDVWPDAHIVNEIPLIYNLETKTQGWKQPKGEGPEMKIFTKLPVALVGAIPKE